MLNHMDSRGEDLVTRQYNYELTVVPDLFSSMKECKLIIKIW